MRGWCPPWFAPRKASPERTDPAAIVTADRSNTSAPRAAGRAQIARLYIGAVVVSHLAEIAKTLSVHVRGRGGLSAGRRIDVTELLLAQGAKGNAMVHGGSFEQL